MSAFPGSPRLVKGGIVLLDPGNATLLKVISLQYNPDTLTRTFQIKAAGGDGGDRSQALRLKGAAVETLKLDAVLDATDQLEYPDQHPDAVKHGIHPQLAVLEAMAFPQSAAMLANDRLAASGTLEVLPVEAPLALFVWSRSRIVPVRLTELSVAEEAFDPALNPIRARVSLGLRVLSVDDVGFGHKGGVLFMNYLQNKESLAAKAGAGALSALGLEGMP
ncbi:CIS tube protein [Micromonospora sp. BQ11]|uniref:CIS tube protein n=1 Tax=Micromonospora sp. BQ11 TaxID=3452212 RepID=UPI003F8A6BCD